MLSTMTILLNIINHSHCRDVRNERNLGLHCRTAEAITARLELGTMHYELISNLVKEEVVNDKCEIWREGETCGLSLRA